MKVSLVIRTYNEEMYLGNLLEGVKNQVCPNFNVEVILVDSGSTDRSVEIAKNYGCVITYIKKEEFSFGKSLNIGCDAATGDVLVFVSGHCIPVNEHWLAKISAPIFNGIVAYTYGGQVGNETSKFSECQIFKKYFPNVSSIPQEGFFCNNANSAIRKSAWEKHQFDEVLTGLEDMHLAKGLVAAGESIGYVADAAVYHLHNETWGKIKNRFEREAIALQNIMPEVHLRFLDFVRYSTSAIFLDFKKAREQRSFFKYAYEIIRYRLAQYWGSYRGNHIHRKLSKTVKEKYFYPV